MLLLLLLMTLRPPLLAMSRPPPPLLLLLLRAAHESQSRLHLRHNRCTCKEKRAAAAANAAGDMYACRLPEALQLQIHPLQLRMHIRQPRLLSCSRKYSCAHWS